MKLLLDTHIALWAIVDDPRLPAAALRVIADPTNEIFISVASIWEIAIKRALARGTSTAIPLSSIEALAHFEQAGYRLLAIESAHAAAVEKLPLLHNDPFDRMLVAQALTEPLRLLTHNRNLAAYSDTVMLL